MVVVAVSLIALIGCGAIATDVGLLWTFKRQMQQAADAAAIAGDREIYSGNASATEPTNTQNAALADVTQTASPTHSSGHRHKTPVLVRQGRPVLSLMLRLNQVVTRTIIVRWR